MDGGWVGECRVRSETDAIRALCHGSSLAQWLSRWLGNLCSGLPNLLTLCLKALDT
jgi:hypothetical protein